MLDGLLGRGGFSSKSKSLLKTTRTRIDVTRRKRNATQKFLKQDIADLLADGLEINAFGRAEGLIAELIISSCYDFIDHVCEIILKHLSIMQKHGECPEDCREAVASLMFAAARFSDLPELRDLRNIFQERYGNSLEYNVNQKLVEHLSPKPPDTEKKLKLLQDIASEFSVSWDSFAYEQKMISNTAATEAGHLSVDEPANHAYMHPAKANKYLAPQSKEIIHKIDNDAPISKGGFEASPQTIRREVLKNEHHARPGTAGILQRQRTNKPSQDQEIVHNKHKPPIWPKAVPKTEDKNAQKSLRREKRHMGRSDASSSFHAERAEPILIIENKISFSGGQENVPEIEHHKAACQAKAESLSVIESTGHFKQGQEFMGSHIQKLQGEDIGKLKSNIKSQMPPPYVKPNKSKHESRHMRLVSGNGDNNDSWTFNPGAENLEPVSTDIPQFTAVYYKEDTSGTDATPRRRSRRRRHKSFSVPSDGENLEEVRVVRRVSTTRRRNESKKGLEILLEQDHHHHPMDTEERMIDKLLLHYSKKPWDRPSEKPRGKTKRGSAYASEDLTKQPSRSISLPREQSSSEFKKVFTRAVSFDEEASATAKHVHPKLPDYDDLAARFAALRRNQV